MPRTSADSEAWKRIVLQAMTLPAWLNEDGPRREIVLSTRVRLMRNLRGHRFPHAASNSELKEIEEEASRAFSHSEFEVMKYASPAERDYLVACRLASPDHNWNGVGRALILDRSRSASVMVNEEDHLRIQALTPGWSFKEALEKAEGLLQIAQKQLNFARGERFGYLAASPSNCGEGRRYSAMFHLIGLAQQRKLGTVIKALLSQGLIVRGLFGERSRAIGAFLQVSTTATSIPYFVGACDYLLDEESRARRDTDPATLSQKLLEAQGFLENSKSITLADALRVLAWKRWMYAQSPSEHGTPRSIDGRIPELALLESLDEPRAGRSRLDVLRRVF